MSNPVTLGEPSVRTKDRSVTARYDTGKITDDGEKVLVTLTVSHHKQGMNVWSGVSREAHFSASIVNETEKDGIIGFTMFSGLGLERRPQARFSAPRLQSFFAEMRDRFEELVAAGDEQVLPYARGEKVR